ncbi:hypothetical protein, partial [Georgenia halophila]|uniref:hypothetical protein n=1 Tax=Georgenia halophila TaxID=620889 RepID=UPI0031EEAF02
MGCLGVGGFGWSFFGVVGLLVVLGVLFCIFGLMRWPGAPSLGWCVGLGFDGSCFFGGGFLRMVFLVVPGLRVGCCWGMFLTESLILAQDE